MFRSENLNALANPAEKAEGNNNPFERPLALEDLIPGIKPKSAVPRPDVGSESTGVACEQEFFNHILDEMQTLYPFDDEAWAGYAKEQRQQQLEVTEAELMQVFERRGGTEHLFKLFKGQVVVDIGCGPGCFGYYLAALAKAKAYVGVDKFFNKNGQIRITSEQIDDFFRSKMRAWPSGFQVHEIPGVAASEDMLDFLRRLPDRSVSILASGIDSYLIPNKEYLQAVNQEIQRVLHPDGVFMSNHSNHLSSGWDKSAEFEEIKNGIDKNPQMKAYKLKKEEAGQL
ncbi:MAG: class I SAM-dependent methyltransferase [Patescibacteria group bacterium]|jgi:SAM-dependent methyltransferase